MIKENQIMEVLNKQIKVIKENIKIYVEVI